jgi:hypothetical protein
MVATECKDTDAPILHYSIKMEGGISCKCCEVLNLELKTLLKLNSAQEIITILWKEHNLVESIPRKETCIE